MKKVDSLHDPVINFRVETVSLALSNHTFKIMIFVCEIWGNFVKKILILCQ